MRKLGIALFCALYLSLAVGSCVVFSGCAWMKSYLQGVGDCIAPAIGSVVETAATTLANDAVTYAREGKAPTSSEWLSHGIELAAKFGWQVLSCAEQHLRAQPTQCKLAKPECHEHPAIGFDYATKGRSFEVPIDASGDYSDGGN
jgi:hypothetical protein